MTGRIFWPIYLITFSKLSVCKDRMSFHSSIKHFWAWTLCQVLGIQRHTSPREPPADVTTHLSPCLANSSPWGEKEKFLETSLSLEVFTCVLLYPRPFLLLFSSWLLFFLQMFHTPVPMSLPNSRCLVPWLRLTDWQVYFLWAHSLVCICICICICVCMCAHVCAYGLR